MYFDISFMIWVLLGALGNYVAAEFKLSPAQKGLMTALPLLGGSLLRIVLGNLSDWIGPRQTGILGMFLTLAPLAAGWLWADSIAKVYLVGLLLGVAGASFAVALPIASRWYPPKFQGLAMGIAGAGNSGTMLATLFAPRLAEVYGWHTVFAFAMLPLALTLLVWITCAKEAPQAVRPAQDRPFLNLLKQRDTYLFSLFYGVTFGGFVGLASFLSIYLRDQFGISKVQAGDLTSVCVLAGSFLRPVGGVLADRLGGIRMLTFLYSAIAFLALSLAQMPTLGLTVILFFLVMACLGMGNGSVFQLVPQRFRHEVGAATGVLGAAGGLGGFLLPILLGSLKEIAGSYSFGWWTFMGIAALALTCLTIVQRAWIGNWIAKHGRAHPVTPLLSGEEMEAV